MSISRITHILLTSVFAFSIIFASNCGQPKKVLNVLVFCETKGFHHNSISVGTIAILELGKQNNFRVDTTSISDVFTDDNLKKYDVVVFLNTTGDALNDDEQNAFKRFIESGKGYVGIHAATDTEYDWEWYGGLIGGAYFKRHPQGQFDAEIVVEDKTHPSTKMLPDRWKWKDEWYDFRVNPRDKVKVLASVDEKTYQGGEMGDHPIIWYQMYDGGRAFYTGLGHMDENYKDPLFLQHLLGGIRWAAGVE